MTHTLDAQIAIISRGSDMSVVLTSLIAQDVRLPVHAVLNQLPGKRDGFLLDTLRRTGAPVSVSLQSQPGVGHARYEVAEWLEASTVICLDDDAMLYPHDALRRMYDGAQESSFCSPIIRYVHNFEGSGMPGHEEVWEEVSIGDPRVQRAVAANGRGWRRVFDFGHDMPSDDLGGTAFACDAGAYEYAVQGLKNWQGGGEDHYLGKKLVNAPHPYTGGEGKILSGVYAYHVGLFTPGKWGFDQVGLAFCRDDPEGFRRHAVPDHVRLGESEQPPSSGILTEASVPEKSDDAQGCACGGKHSEIHGGTSLPVTERSWSPAVPHRMGFQA